MITFGEEHHRGDVFLSGPHIWGSRYYALITGGVNLDLLIKVVSEGLPLNYFAL